MNFRYPCKSYHLFEFLMLEKFTKGFAALIQPFNLYHVWGGGVGNLIPIVQRMELVVEGPEDQTTQDASTFFVQDSSSRLCRWLLLWALRGVGPEGSGRYNWQTRPGAGRKVTPKSPVCGPGAARTLTCSISTTWGLIRNVVVRGGR